MLVFNGGVGLTACDVIEPDFSSDWTYVGNDIGGTIQFAVCDGPSETMTIVLQNANPGVTGHAVAPTIAYNNADADNSIANADGPMLPTGAVNLTDGAAPQIISAAYQDLEGNGVVDMIALTFSEELHADSVLKPSHLSISNVGDFTGLAFGAGTDDAITIATNNISFNLNALGTPSSVIDTHDDSGDFEISTILGDGTMSLTDGTNANTTVKIQTQATILDRAAPVIASVTPTDGRNQVSRHASITATFSESMEQAFVENTQFSISPVVANAVWTPTWSNNDTVVTLHHTVAFASL